MNITSGQWKQILLEIAVKMEQEKDLLSELDRAIGDGDHGITMSMGWQAIAEKLEELKDEQNCGEINKAIGKTFLNAVGSSVGPLYATAFLRGSIVVQGKSVLNQEDVVQFWAAAVNGIVERGKAQVGEKTMVDTWVPAIQALQQVHKDGQDLIACLEAAVAAGGKGMESTIHMLSQKGRSSRLGGRSLGHQDPGATSAYIILAAFTEGVKRL